MPDYDFDPRIRTWYQVALDAHASVLTEPYVFHASCEVGITMAREATLAGAIHLNEEEWHGLVRSQCEGDNRDYLE